MSVLTVRTERRNVMRKVIYYVFISIIVICMCSCATDSEENEIISIIFGQDTDKVCYVANIPIYITLDKEHRSIIISLIQFPSSLIDYTVIFDEMDIVIEETKE